MIVIIEKVANTRHQIQEDLLTQDDDPSKLAFMQEVTCVSASGGARIMLQFDIVEPGEVDRYKPGETYNLTLERV